MSKKYSYYEKQSRAIEILRFPLAVFVVAIHCYYFNAQGINKSIDTSAQYVKGIIDFCSIILTDCAVPMFFAISGYLYFLKKNRFTFKEYAIKMGGKCNTLLIPYLIWNFIAIIAYPMDFVEASWTERIFGFYSRKITWGSLSGPWDGPLWFLRDLFVVMLFSPLISLLIRKTNILLPIVLSFVILLGYNAIFPGLSVVSFLYFCTGSYLAIIRPEFSKVFECNRVRWCLIFLAIMFLFARACVMGNIIREYVAIINFGWILSSAVIYFMIAMYIGTSTNHYHRWITLGASSFVIFAMHGLVIGRISSTLLWIVGKQNVGSFLTIAFYFFTIIAGVSICYIAHRLISHYPIVSMLLEGGRKR